MAKLGLTEFELGWTAGIIDGEGTIALHRLNGEFHYVYPRVFVTNTHYGMIELLHGWFGGNIKVLPLKPAPCKQAWKWEACEREIVKPLLTAILPGLTEKRKRAELLLEYMETCPALERGTRARPYRTEVQTEIYEHYMAAQYELRKQFHEKMWRLNHPRED
jgi:hypothetical protein